MSCRLCLDSQFTTHWGNHSCLFSQPFSLIFTTLTIPRFSQLGNLDVLGLVIQSQGMPTYSRTPGQSQPTNKTPEPSTELKRRQKTNPTMLQWNFPPFDKLRRVLLTHHSDPDPLKGTTKAKTLTPSIICEHCHQAQSQQTTSNAVLASLTTLNAYFLAILNDLETQYATNIRSRAVETIVCFLLAATVLGIAGFGFWMGFLVLPWILGLWNLWWCAGQVLEDLVNRLADSEPIAVDE